MSNFRSRLRVLPALVAILALSSFTYMHLHLKASLPGADSTVESAPGQIMLIFSARPEPALSRVQLFGPDSSLVKTGKLIGTADSLALAAPIDGKLAPGKYSVRWRAAGRDGHPSSGEFGFTVATAAAGRTAQKAATSRDHSAN